MKKVFFLLIVVSSVSFAQQPPKDITINPEKILLELERIEKQQQSIIGQAKQMAVSKVQSAAASGTAAADFYAQGIKATRFSGPSDAVKYIDWKKQNGELLRSNDFQNACLMSLRYLLLSLQRADAEDGTDFTKPSYDYAMLLRPLLDKFRNSTKAVPGEAVQILNENIGNSVFVKFLGLDPYLPQSGNDWENSPGKFRGILEKNIASVYRENKNPNIISIWDAIIDFEASEASKGKSGFAINQFNEVERPPLMFARANDMVLVGLKNRGIQEIFNLAKASPTHSDFQSWVTRIRELIAANSATVAPSAPEENNAAEQPAPTENTSDAQEAPFVPAVQ